MADQKIISRDFLTGLTAYRIVAEETLDDIHADGILLEHIRSGARVMLILNDDENKVFSIGFRTPPADSTGVAHIIEHSVLCGSEEFPLKDPFVELVKGSLNTFLNAMTFPDKTVYPIASTNDADFHNLMHVYLDAVFRPNIYREEKIFRQEGWRYEMEDESSPLVLNGVVYNEMKGAFSSADSVLERETMNALFPDTAYGVESGGDPQCIPDLTYEAFKEFHRKYYHPSNSYIYLYGDIRYAEELAFLDEHYLSAYERISLDSALRAQEPFAGRQAVWREYPVTEPEEEEGHVLLSWSAVAGDPYNEEEMTALQVLDYALFSAPGAPVKQALIDAGVGMDVYGEVNDGILQPYFSVISRDMGKEDAERFEGVLLHALRHEVEEGIDRKALTAGLNAMEFSFREADFGSYPRGLMYGLDVLSTWLYDDSRAFSALRRLHVFDSLRKKMEEGYFENLIEEKLLNNPHGAMVVLVPKAGLAEEREAELAGKLAARKAGMGGQEIRETVESTRALKEWQEAPESEDALASIPLLARSDIRREVRKFSNIEEMDSSGKTRIVFHEAPANGIIYLDLLFDISHIAPERLPMLGLLKNALLNMDTEHFRYQDLNNEINAATGGISCRCMNADLYGKPHEYLPFFCVQGKALSGGTARLAELMDEVMERTRFGDKKRLFELVSQTRIQMQSTLQEAGHAAAALRVSAYYSESAAFQEQIGGITFFRFIQDLEQDFEAKWEDSARELAALAAEIFAGSRMLVSCTCEEGDRALVKDLVHLCVPEGRAVTAEAVKVPLLGRRNEAFRTAGQVQFTAMGGWYVERGYAYTGAMQILRQILSYEYLWQNVRVQGGAYGCGGSLRMTGDGIFTSYRDPNLRRTKEVFQGIPDYLRSFTADERRMTKFIIGTMSAVDQPMTPSMFGRGSMSAYLTRISDEDRQKSRDEILGATEETIRGLADAAEAVVAEDYFCVIGGSQAVDRDAELFGQVENLV